MTVSLRGVRAAVVKAAVAAAAAAAAGVAILTEALSSAASHHVISPCGATRCQYRRSSIIATDWLRARLLSRSDPISISASVSQS